MIWFEIRQESTWLGKKRWDTTAGYGDYDKAKDAFNTIKDKSSYKLIKVTETELEMKVGEE